MKLPTSTFEKQVPVISIFIGQYSCRSHCQLVLSQDGGCWHSPVASQQIRVYRRFVVWKDNMLTTQSRKITKHSNLFSCFATTCESKANVVIFAPAQKECWTGYIFFVFIFIMHVWLNEIIILKPFYCKSDPFYEHRMHKYCSLKNWIDKLIHLLFHHLWQYRLQYSCSSLMNTWHPSYLASNARYLLLLAPYLKKPHPLSSLVPNIQQEMTKYLNRLITSVFLK